MKQRIYIDTSVVGGYFDEIFEEATKLLFERLERKEIVFVLSEVLDEELKDAPEHVKNLLKMYDEDCFERVQTTIEAETLADLYIAENVIGLSSLKDAQHIAIATLNKADVLASWNFKHIVNLIRINGYNSVNLKNGYKTLEIRNPKEILNYENI